MSLTSAYLDVGLVSSQYDYLHKILMIGDSAVGKTSIVQRFSDDAYTESFIATIGVDLRIRSFTDSSGRQHKLQLWDTAGQERFRSIATSYFRGADGIVLVYDRTEPDSLRSLTESWMAEIDRHAAPKAMLYLIGNKEDLVAREPGGAARAAACDDIAREFMEMCPRIVAHLKTSAKSGAGVDAAFQDLARLLSEQSRQRQLDNDKRRRRLQERTEVGGWSSAFSFCSIL